MPPAITAQFCVNRLESVFSAPLSHSLGEAILVTRVTGLTHTSLRVPGTKWDECLTSPQTQTWTIITRLCWATFSAWVHQTASNRSESIESSLHNLPFCSLSVWIWRALRVRFISSRWHHGGIILCNSFLSLFLFPKFSKQHRWSAVSARVPAHSGSDATRWPTRGQRRDGQPDRWWETQMTRLVTPLDDLSGASFKNQFTRLQEGQTSLVVSRPIEETLTSQTSCAFCMKSH